MAPSSRRCSRTRCWPADIKNAILALKPLTANLYEGDYTGDILIDMRPSIPTVALNGMLKKANASLLFTNIMQKNNYPFTGTLDMSTMLKFTLGEPYTLRKTLNGNITIRLQNGVLHGINIPALIELGQAFFQQTALPPVAKNQTDFGVMKGTFQIQNGVMVNQDLTLQSSELTATGWGKINLVDEKIDYHLKAGLVGHQTAVPILIRGNIDHPMVMPDTEQLATETLKEHVNQLKDKLKEKYGDKLKSFNLASLLG
jgi:AsmA protein